jgi:PAS domain S-box-containing protein
MRIPSHASAPSAAQERPSIRARPKFPAALALLALASSLGITYWTWDGAREVDERDQWRHFEYSVRDAEARITQRMLAYEQVLRAAAGLFATSEYVERREFREFVASLVLDERYPGIQGVGWSIIVPASTIDAHTAEVRREGFAEYSIRPPGERDSYTSILYLEPFAGRNLRAFGYDMFSEPIRRAAMESARDTGDAALSGRVTLVQETETDVQAGVLMYVPVYRRARPHDTLVDRRANIIGWVYSPFRIRDLMVGTFGEHTLHLDVEIFDGAEPSLSTLIYDTDAAPFEANHSKLRTKRELELGGRRWTMLVRASPSFEAHVASDRPRSLALAGVIASVLLASLVWLLASGRARALREALALNREIAERKRVGDELRESETLYRSLFTLAPSGVVLLDGEGRLLAFNDQAHQQLGFTRDEFAGLTLSDLEADEPPGVLAGRPSTHRPGEFEVRHRTRSGEVRNVLVSGRQVDTGREKRFLAVWQDITERKRAEQALRASEERLRQTLKYAEAGTWEWSILSGEVFWSAESCALLGVAARTDAATFAEWESCIHPDDLARVNVAVADAVTGASAEYMAEYRARDPHRGWRWVLGLGRVERARDGTPVRMLGINIDITHRKAAEDACRCSEERFRALIEKAMDMTLILDAEGRIVFWSPSATEALGWASEEVLGRATSELIHPEDAGRAAEALAAIIGRPGATASVSMRVRHKDGSWRLIESLRRNLLEDSAVEGVVVNARDVTEQRRLEEQLRQAQSLESIGRLAGGIAHDFNNLLTVILAGTEQLSHGPREGLHPDLEIVQEIDTAAARARDLTQQLLAFARKQVIAPIALDLNALVLNAEKLLRRVLGEDVELTVQLDPSLGTVRCDPSQLEQIILNLAVNARDAMPRGGCLTIATDNVRVAGGQSPRRADAAPGAYVRLAVRDSGCGMSADVKARLFEPFFTTKPPGKGTGLGLATVYGIVKQSNGHIHVESEPGEGTVFEILFPRALAVPAAANAPAAPVSMRGTETVLVVEDDPQVREVTVRSLQAGGYEVLTAASGREALELTEHELACVRLLVTDVVMPGIDGRTLVDALRARHPALSVLYVSGYTHDTIAERGVLASGVEFLPKPFTTRTLLARVRAVIDSSRCARAAQG